jgi:probable rRNA maturation factor
VRGSPGLTVDCSVDASEGLTIPPEVTEGSVIDLVRFALERERQNGSWNVSFALVTVAEISELHDRFLGDPSPTDIITFPYDDPDVSGGDVAICVPVAAEQGAEHGNTLAEELYFLVLHGVLHLTGHDDETPQERAAMLARQREIYSEWRAVSR